MNIIPSRLRSERGAAFLTVIIFTFLLIAIIASVLQWSLTERSLVARNAHWLEARNAAEGVTEFGFAQIDNAFMIHANPPTFDPAGSNPLTLPATSYWGGATDISGLSVIGGPVELIPAAGTSMYYVDPNNPINATDPLKGQYVYRRDIQVVGTATVNPPEGGIPITAYVTESVSVRGAPLFANAIFYSSNDLEIFPGPTMNIYGPVHANGNMFAVSMSSSLNFYGPVSISGNLYHAWANSNTASWGTGNQTLGQDPVTFANSVGTQVNLDGNGLSTGWNDSTMGASNGVSGLSNLQALVTPSVSAAFRTATMATYVGNLQTLSMGVQAYNPVSFNEQIDSSGDQINPHTMIDPPQAQVSTDTYLANKEDVEKEKFANQAGLYIKVTVTPGTTTAAATANIQIFGAPGSAPSGTPAAQVGPNLLNPTDPTSGGLLLNAPLASAAGAVPLVTFIPYVKQVTTYTAASSGHFTKAVTYVNSAGSTISSGSFNVNSYNSSTNVVSTSTYTPSTTTVTSNPGNSTAIVNGMVDQRRLMDGSADDGPPGIDLVQVDMGAVTKAVNDMLTNTNLDTQAITQGSLLPTVWTGWNGGIYVDVEQTGALAPTVSTTGTNYGYTYSNMQPASVRLVDGTVADGSSLIPAVNGGTNINQLPVYPQVGTTAASTATNPGGNGLSIATNAPVYILGNYNADGTITSSSSTTPDSTATLLGGTLTTESPCCIAADAVTILSPAWSDANSSTVSPSTSSTVEIASALLTGITPTSNANNSGGAHNLPRFLENWNGTTVAIRGSLTCLYPSKIATQPFSGAYYGAPSRNWGFDTNFANGHFPPMTPKVISFRRVAFNSLTAAAYASALHTMWPTEY